MTPASTTARCAGTTKAGSRCQRRAVAGEDYCKAHLGTGTDRGAARSTSPPRETGGQPSNGATNDIDRGALRAVIDELGAARAGGARDSSTWHEITQAVSWLAENTERIRDVAVERGLIDGKRAEQLYSDIADAVSALGIAAMSRITGEYEEDDFGFDEQFTNALVPLFGLLYDYYWRVDVHGIDNVPAAGPGLLVSNHAGGGLPFDGAMIKMAIMREHAQPRHARMLVLDWAMGLPYLGDFLRRTGQTLAHSENAIELLERDCLVGVFPEGIKGIGKSFSQRYNLQRFGRGGFVKLALRTGSPIIPVAVVGSEEIYPKIANMPLASKLLGAPFVPVTPTFPWFGLLGLMPLPSKWHIEFCEPIDVSGYGPEAADDRGFVLEMSEQIRSTTQERLRDNLLRRQTPFW